MSQQTSGCPSEPLCLDVDAAPPDRVTPRHLVALDRLASLGSVVRGVVHEVNNPLTTVLTNLNFVAELLAELCAPGAEVDLDQLQEVAAAVTDVREGALRVRDIVRDLHALAADVPLTPLDLERVLGSALRIVGYDLRQRARVEVSLAGGLPEVDAEEGLLGQLFLALLLNAAQAIAPGDPGHNVIRVLTRADGAGRVVVEVHDTGAGLPEAVRPHLLEPLRTTKAPGVGTGLGLHACHAIAVGLGATLEFLREEGRTVVRLAVPARTALRPAPGALPQPARRGRVMVIDHDATIGATVARVLRGHEVLLLTSAREALARLLRGERYDVILCDLMMPDMTGIELHEELSRAVPDALERLAFLSGGAFTDEAAAFVARVPNALLEKPFDPAALRAFVAARVAER